MTHSKFRPDENAVPVNEPVTVTLNSGEEASVTFSPIKQVSEHVVITLAVSKSADTTYTIEMDGTAVFGPASIPPTDIDDSVQTFMPPRDFSQHCKVKISNLGSSTTTYHVQLVGFERGGGE